MFWGSPWKDLAGQAARSRGPGRWEDVWSLRLRVLLPESRLERGAVQVHRWLLSDIISLVFHNTAFTQFIVLWSNLKTLPHFMKYSPVPAAAGHAVPRRCLVAHLGLGGRVGLMPAPSRWFCPSCEKLMPKASWASKKLERMRDTGLEMPAKQRRGCGSLFAQRW